MDEWRLQLTVCGLQSRPVTRRRRRGVCVCAGSVGGCDDCQRGGNHVEGVKSARLGGTPPRGTRPRRDWPCHRRDEIISFCRRCDDHDESAWMTLMSTMSFCHRRWLLARPPALLCCALPAFTKYCVVLPTETERRSCIAVVPLDDVDIALATMTESRVFCRHAAVHSTDSRRSQLSLGLLWNKPANYCSTRSFVAFMVLIVHYVLISCLHCFAGLKIPLSKGLGVPLANPGKSGKWRY